MSRYRKSNKKDLMKSISYIAIYFLFLGVTGIYLIFSYWYIWVALVAGSFFILIFWDAKATAYSCPICGHEFEISMITDLVSPHGVTSKGGWKYLKCPNCFNRSKMEILVKTMEKNQV